MAEHQKSGYEKRDINLSRTFLYGIATIVVLVVCAVALFSYFEWVIDTEYRRAVLEAPTTQLDEIRAREDSILTTYELVDTTESKYRIPIEQAMELLVIEGVQNK